MSTFSYLIRSLLCELNSFNKDMGVDVHNGHLYPLTTLITFILYNK
jgi:hypothetical protein